MKNIIKNKKVFGGMLMAQLSSIALLVVENENGNNHK